MDGRSPFITDLFSVALQMVAGAGSRARRFVARPLAGRCRSRRARGDRGPRGGSGRLADLSDDPRQRVDLLERLVEGVEVPEGTGASGTSPGTRDDSTGVGATMRFRAVRSCESPTSSPSVVRSPPWHMPLSRVTHSSSSTARFWSVRRRRPFPPCGRTTVGRRRHRPCPRIRDPAGGSRTARPGPRGVLGRARWVGPDRRDRTDQPRGDGQPIESMASRGRPAVADGRRSSRLHAEVGAQARQGMDFYSRYPDRVRPDGRQRR